MKVSDLHTSDPEILFYDSDRKHYFRLKYKNCIVDGFDESPLTVILCKGERVYKKDLYNAHKR